MPEPVWIELTEIETMFAAVAGAMRHYNAVLNGRHDAIGVKGDFDTSLARHVNGAGGEQAVAKCCGKYWGGPRGVFKGPDIGRNIQVRTRTRHDWELPVREGERDDHVFFLVTGIVPRFAVRGWIMGRDAKRPDWWKDHGGLPPAFFVPQDELNGVPPCAS